MLVVLPLGLFIAAVVFDALYLWRGSTTFAAVGYWNIAGGILGGLLAALFAVAHSEQVHVLDRTDDGPKPALVAQLDATYHHDGLAAIDERFDVILECTGDAELMMETPTLLRPNGIVCLLGVTDEGSMGEAVFARDMVLENQTMFGTVNANRRHYEEAARVLEDTDRSWLEHLVDRRVPLDRWEDAYRADSDAVKTIIELKPSQ